MRDKYGPEYEKYAEHFRRKVWPGLCSSQTFVIFLPDSPKGYDVKLATELGAAVLLGKKIVVVMAPEVVVPEKLCRLVDQFIEADVKDPVEWKRLRMMIIEMGGDPRRN